MARKVVPNYRADALKTIVALDGADLAMLQTEPFSSA
jgi:hypothetical protein